MKASRLEFVRSVIAMIGAQLVLTGLATHFASLRVRHLVMFAVTAISMVVLAAMPGVSRKAKLVAVFLSTLISIVCVYWWRRLVDPLGFMGVIPTSLEIPALGVSALLTILFATIVAYVSDRNSRAYRFRWLFAFVLSGLVIAGLVPLSPGNGRVSTSMRLQRVIQLEAQLDSSGPFERQELSFLLGAFGRGAESQAFSTRHAQPHGRDKRANEAVVDSEKELSSTAVAWRQAISEIAARERIVIIMEAHNATQHREWIEQTLAIFHNAGFRHYAAEALDENGSALKSRGFPLETTGFYVADPRFGNLLRRAIVLDYSIHEYEAHLAFEPQQREEQQAQTLANIIAANPDGKLLVHVGFAHVFKQPVPGFGQWMAARLRKKTGIEPYCIYQGHDQYDSPGYRRLVELAGAADQPKLLIPPPSDLSDPQFADIPAGAIDALVVHPVARGKSPASRKPTFPSDMTTISGRWLGEEWPIVVGAYRTGEPVDAIALDQVLLRHGESEFELWIPDGPYELRVASAAGAVKIDVERDQTAFRLRRSRAIR